MEFAMETENLRERMDELRKEKLDCFKLCFRIKVADACLYERICQLEEDWKLTQPEGECGDFKESQEYKDAIAKIQQEIDEQRTIIVSFIKSSPEFFDAIQNGQRVRLYNVKPDGTVSMQGSQIKNEQCVFL